MKSDHELIQAYVDDGSDSAFAELVRRHAGTVYGSALRQLQNPHAAEEICQTVFILLSKKASSLRSGTLLIGWLMQATRYAVLDHRKTEHRRFQRETAAFEMTTLNSDATQDEESTLWMQLSPRLDEAVGDLGELDRQAIWLRFFQHKSLAEIGQALGCAEDAARKRVARALERLQQELRKRGVSSPLSSLPAVLGTQLSPAAPPQLIEATLGAIAKPTASSLVLAEQVAKQFALATLKSWLAPTLACGLLLCGTLWTIYQFESDSSPPALEALASDYRRAGFPRPDPVHELFRKLREDAVAGNHQAVAAICQFPLKINNEGRTSWIQTPAELASRFDSIFTPGVCGILLKSPLQGLLCTPQGVAVGDGAVWVAPDPKSGDQAKPVVIAINLQ